MVICNYFEDMYVPGNFNIFVPEASKDVMPSELVIFDVIQVLILLIYIADNTLYTYTYGIKKKVRIYHLIFEYSLLLTIMIMSLIEILDKGVRFRAFFLRLLDTVLIYRKMNTSQMLFVQGDLKQKFKLLNTEIMNPDERIITILKFIE
jgi:hypothetical protein